MPKKAKPYKPGDRLLVEHEVTKETYGVSATVFESSFQARGYVALSFEDGRPFENGAAATEPEPEDEPATAGNGDEQDAED